MLDNSMCRLLKKHHNWYHYTKNTIKMLDNRACKHHNCYHHIIQYYKNVEQFHVSSSKEASQLVNIIGCEMINDILINFYLVVVWLKMIDEVNIVKI